MSEVQQISEKESRTNSREDGRGSTASSHTVAQADELPAEKEIVGVEEEINEYPTGLRLALVTLALCLSVFLMALDNTIIATAIPKITDHFKSLEDVGWYGSAYMLTTACFQLLFGKFYTLFSIKWVYIVAIVLFELGSLICGVAPSSTVLIVGRAIAGLGSAGIFSGALIIIAYSVPLQRRPLFSGGIGAMYGLASVAGPLLGGVFTDKVTWRWCFYINLPIGAITLIVMVFFFKSPKNATKKQDWREGLKKFDLIGTLVFLPAIISLLLALQWGGTKYPWNSGRIIGLLVVFGVLIIAFIFIQRWKKDDATVPGRIFSQRSIYTSAWFSFSISSSFMIMIYFIPFWFQSIKGTSAVQSGIDNLPMILSVVVASILAGGFTSATGYYTPWMIVGTVFASVGAGLLTTFKPNTATGMWVGYQLLFGFGVGAGMQQPLMAAQTVLPLADVPSGTAIIIFAQTAGGAIFISIGQNVFSNKLVSGIIQNAPGVNPAHILEAGATGLKNVVSPEQLPGILTAYNDALVSAFYASVAMAALSVLGSGFVEWKSMKKSANGGQMAMHMG